MLYILAPAAMAGDKKAESQLRPGDMVVITGDSITVQHLYSVYVETYLLMCRPVADLRVMQLGYHGEVAWAFAFRVNEDVTPFRPNVVLACYGMNDGGYMGVTPVTVQSFREGTTAYVEGLKKAGVRTVLLGSPTAVDTATYKGDAAEYNQTLNALRDAAEEVAREQGLVFVDMHDPLIDVMGKVKDKWGQEFAFIGRDGFHPGPAAQLVMAYHYLKALGCDGEIGTITYDVSTGKAQASEGHRVLSADRGAMEIESSRYPFCFFGKPYSEDGTMAAVEFVRFNEELNRFRLVVKGGEGRRVRVTWGEASKEFDGDRLARGINLAAEFVESNPFHVAHKAVEYAVMRQQDYETAMVRDLKAAITDVKKVLPEEKDLHAKLEAAAYGKLERLREESVASVRPVTHRIRVEIVGERVVETR